MSLNAEKENHELRSSVAKVKQPHLKVPRIKGLAELGLSMANETEQESKQSPVMKDSVQIMNETKQERQLLNHQRYLRLWD